ncbi:MAG: tripartite tricarboxylate transporter substrate binding protein [Betaproteobacteria bacterium]|nr:tripartite tricarboxylate transporter substrate binding protein [Betaproteobacteria bacterium]
MISCPRHLAFFAALVFSLGASAQEYPSRLVRIISGGSGSGPVDIASRVVAQRLSEIWGQPVIVETRTGASEMIAAEAVAKSKPDGYTMLSAGNIITHTPAIFRVLLYDPVRSFAPVTLMMQSPMALVVNASAPYNSLKDLIAAAKQRPGQIAWASAGIGTNNHVTGEQFAAEAGIKVIHAPYKGSQSAANAVIGGEVAYAIVALSSALTFAKAGTLKVFAVTTENRTSLAPDVPTIAELGVPGVDGAVRGGLYVPAGTPENIIAKLSVDINRILKEPATRQRFAALGLEALGTTPVEYEAINRKIAAQVVRIVTQANIKVE